MRCDTLPLIALFLLSAVGAVTAQDRWLFDLGEAEVEEPYASVLPDRIYSPAAGFGWIAPAAVNVDRQDGPNLLLRDFAWSEMPATFRVDLPPGIYRLSVTCGDMNVGNHATAVQLNPEGVEFPSIKPLAGEFITVSAAFGVEQGFLSITFKNLQSNWLVNAITVEKVEAEEPVSVQRERLGPPPRGTYPTGRAGWPNLQEWGNPVKEPLERFLARQTSAEDISATGLRARDYLRVIAGNVDFFIKHQAENGAIIDPYEKQEMQYSTPAFALAAATLVRHAGREDLREAAELAMDWATHSLKRQQAPQHHEHFFPHMLAYALRHLQAGGTSPDRLERWRADLREYDPIEVFRGIDGGNWNVVAMAGQAMLYLQGVREDVGFVERSLEVQGRYFNEWGLYVDGGHEAMAYDLFPRLWLNDLLAHGWEGIYAEELREVLWRGALTSLLIQSPAGELPTGMRSSNHQWNEAQQAATFEIFAIEAARRGDEVVSRAFKRGARLSLRSILRWVRPSGELWIVKNKVDPSQRHGYEAYSFHSQYNLLAMGMLAIAYEHARQSEGILEGPAPADVGGFVIDLREHFHKVIANAGGHYVLIDTAGHHAFDPTGLVRVHHARGNPQLGPTQGLVQRSSGVAAAVGVAWEGQDGNWQNLAQYHQELISGTDLAVLREEPRNVALQVSYQAEFNGADEIVETYTITPERVVLTTEVRGNDGSLWMMWPLLADDGECQPEIRVGNAEVSVRLGLSKQRFLVPGAVKVTVDEEVRPFRNGWARLVVAEFPPGTEPRIEIETEW